MRDYSPVTNAIPRAGEVRFPVAAAGPAFRRASTLSRATRWVSARRGSLAVYAGPAAEFPGPGVTPLVRRHVRNPFIPGAHVTGAPLAPAATLRLVRCTVPHPVCRARGHDPLAVRSAARVPATLCLTCPSAYHRLAAREPPDTLILMYIAANRAEDAYPATGNVKAAWRSG